MTLTPQVGPMVVAFNLPACIIDQIHPPASMFVPFLPEIVTKVCNDGGYWFQHPESNRTWTNYTRCNEHTNEGRVVG